MPAPWFATALKAIPWSVLWAQAPAIIDASRKLFVRWGDAKPGAEAAPSERTASSLESRLAALEQNEKSQAALLQQIAAQIEQLTAALEVVAARVRLALGLSTAALLIVAVSALWLLLR